MKNITPTVREVKVAAAACDVKLDVRMHWNDKRKNGGRIKMWVREPLVAADMMRVGSLIKRMFPKLETSIYNWERSTVCVKWNAA